jgi:exopolysaccharide biosynthesis WecB/TagA/CpsF family protein
MTAFAHPLTLSSDYLLERPAQFSGSRAVDLRVAETAPEAAETAEREFALALLARLESGVGGTVTWLNHYSAMQSLRGGVPLERFDHLGVDGILLCRLLGSAVPRTSADLVLPELLAHADPLRVALIGSTRETLHAVAAKIEAQYGHRVVLVRDGFDELPAAADLRSQLRAARVQVAVVGLGAPLQDHYALAAASPEVLVITCGGWLDQFAADAYYPAWAYPLRLNWLVRLAREPKRLWRRYSVDALRALRSRAELVHYVTVVGRRPLAEAFSRPEASSVHVSAA